MKKKVALCFFGITRSLGYTIGSIEKYVISQLKEYGFQVEIYLHTYSLSKPYVNKRANEKCELLNNDEYKLLKPDFFQIDQQELIMEQLDLTKYRTCKDPWKSNYNCVNNFILAQYSKLQITNMVQSSGKEYDKIIFLRPDVLYLNVLKKEMVDSSNDKTLCIPNFHRYGKYGFNDRFAICSHENFALYGSVFNELYEISKEQELHSETVLGQLLKVKYKLKLRPIIFRFNRVRCNGKMNKDIPQSQEEHKKLENEMKLNFRKV
tara:strand:+ start:1696 stop:2487 length:792 start_codon:yes stop_codon:yes gene_type:complete